MFLLGNVEILLVGFVSCLFIALPLLVLVLLLTSIHHLQRQVQEMQATIERLQHQLSREDTEEEA